MEQLRDHRDTINRNLPNQTDTDITVPNKDSIDHFTDHMDRTNTAFFGGTALFTAGIMLETFSNNPQSATLALAGGLIFGAGAIGSLDSYIGERFRRKDIITNHEYGYTAIPLLYHGKDPLQKGEATLNNGDQYLMMHMPPIITTKPDNPHYKRLIASFQKLATEDVIQRAQEKGIEYKAVCLYSPLHATEDTDGNHTNNSVRMKELFKGRRAVHRDEDPSYVLITPEEFESGTVDKQTQLKKACEAIGDQQLLQCFSLLSSAHTPEHLLEAKGIFNRRLNIILQRELDINISTPGFKYSVDDNHNPKRRRVESMMYVTQRAEELHSMLLSDLGEIENVSVDRILSGNAKELDTVIDSSSSLKRAELAYIAHHMLKDMSFEELTTDLISDPDQLFSLLEQTDIIIFGQIPDRNYDLSKVSTHWESTLHSLRNIIAPILLATLASITLRTGYQELTDNTAYGWDWNSSYHSQYNSVEDKGRADFPLTVPKRGLDWKITTSGDIEDNGYYTLYTSSQMVDGAWQFEQGISDVYSYEDGFPTADTVTDVPYIELEKRISVEKSLGAELKIPIKENTTLGGLSIYDKDGKELPAVVFYYQDGTIGVHIGTLSNGVYVNHTPVDGYFDIKARLIDTTNLDPQYDEKTTTSSHTLRPIKETKTSAVQPITSPDYDQLSPDVQDRIFNHAIAPISTEEKIASITHDVQNRHLYSLAPQGAEKLNEATTKEEMLNILHELEGCKCDTCNTEAALIASFVSTPEFFTNYAQGYIHTPDNSSNTSYLLSQESHGFQIDNFGQVVDATATTFADDELTRQFIELMNSSNEHQQDEEWNKALNEIDDNKLLEYIKIAGGLLALTAGVKFYRPAIEKIQRISDKQALKEWSDNVMLKTMDRSDLERAYSMFTYYTYSGNPDSYQPIQNNRFEDLTNEELFDSIRRTIPVSTFEDFLQPPHSYLQHADISIVDSFKIKVLARYFSI